MATVALSTDLDRAEQMRWFRIRGIVLALITSAAGPEQILSEEVDDGAKPFVPVANSHVEKVWRPRPWDIFLCLFVLKGYERQSSFPWSFFNKLWFLYYFYFPFPSNYFWQLHCRRVMCNNAVQSDAVNKRSNLRWHFWFQSIFINFYKMLQWRLKIDLDNLCIDTNYTLYLHKIKT